MASATNQIIIYGSVSDFVDEIIGRIDDNGCKTVSVIAGIDFVIDMLRFMYNENMLALDYVGMSEPLWLYEPICVTFDADYSVSVDAVKSVFGDYIESGADAVFVYDSVLTCNYANYLSKNNSDYELITIND